MSEQGEDDGEIEFLDEDADIVQQCVQNVENDSTFAETNSNSQIVDTPLLVERFQEKQKKEERQERSRRKRKKDDDVDYDPTEDIPQRHRRRRTFIRPVTRSRRFEFVSRSDFRIKKDPFDPSVDVVRRRKLQLRIPDYDDPLCLPVRALKKEDQEQRKLKNWNNLCLERFKNYDTLLRVEQQPTVSSKRTVVLRNLHNKMTGKVETTIYSKITVENKKGEKKTEVVQFVLPKYREKKLLNNYRLTELKKHKTFHTKEEVIITKEVHKEVESLVVYKPTESLSTVYKIFEKRGEELESSLEEENMKYLKEVACCKMCASCYQTSWRAIKETNNKKLQCHICNRPCTCMYNLLTHLKGHSDADVRAYKKAVAKSLATVMEYHYKCRICQEQFLGIKELRQHVRTHKGSESFKCELCNLII